LLFSKKLLADINVKKIGKLQRSQWIENLSDILYAFSALSVCTSVRVQLCSPWLCQGSAPNHWQQQRLAVLPKDSSRCRLAPGYPWPSVLHSRHC